MHDQHAGFFCYDHIVKQVMVSPMGPAWGIPAQAGTEYCPITRRRKELSEDILTTTIVGNPGGVRLEALKEPCEVMLFSDSQYLVNAIEDGWAKRWKANGWRRNRKEPALNSDLWERLLGLCEYHRVSFQWVRGHNGHAENERCDALAVMASKAPNLLCDEDYEVTAGHRMSPI
jgi:ribonuclease HI